MHQTWTAALTTTHYPQEQSPPLFLFSSSLLHSNRIHFKAPMADAPSRLPRGAYNLPHPPYAEDQPLSYTILTTHVLYRGFQSGALVGGLIGLVRSPQPLSTGILPSKSTAILRSAGRGSLWGTALLAIALPARMWGRTDIEWRDRAWRLLENQGQISTDYWSGGGAVAGAALAGLRSSGRGALFVLGASGIGSLVGTGGSMGWRMANGTFK